MQRVLPKQKNAEDAESKNPQSTKDSLVTYSSDISRYILRGNLN